MGQKYLIFPEKDPEFYLEKDFQKEIFNFSRKGSRILSRKGFSKNLHIITAALLMAFRIIISEYYRFYVIFGLRSHKVYTLHGHTLELGDKIAF